LLLCSAQKMSQWANSITRMISEIHPSRPIHAADPDPIEITTKVEGPYVMDKGMILCNECGHIIRKSYFHSHQQSGACQRAVQHMREKDVSKHHETTKCNT